MLVAPFAVRHEQSRNTSFMLVLRLRILNPPQQWRTLFSWPLGVTVVSAGFHRGDCRSRDRNVCLKDLIIVVELKGRHSSLASPVNAV